MSKNAYFHHVSREVNKLVYKLVKSETEREALILANRFFLFIFFITCKWIVKLYKMD